MSEKPGDSGRRPQGEGGDHQGLTEPAAELSLDEVFELLADRRRRLVIYVLAEQPGRAMAFDDLVDAVVELAADLGGRPWIDEKRDDLAAELYQHHLPKLADAGLLEYDVRSRTVRYWHQPTVEKWTEHAVETSRRRTGGRRTGRS